MALQLFDQVDPKVAKLVKNLQELGREYLRKYPESTKGRFTFFPHTNQPIAQHLKYLDSSVNNADELMGTLRRLFNGFSDTGTLLNDAYDLVLQSRLYLAVIIKNNMIQNIKDEGQRNDDGGGYSGRWELRDYQAALSPIKDSQLSAAVTIFSADAVAMPAAVLDDSELPTAVAVATPAVKATPL
jgi:hypothetical protein